MNWKVNEIVRVIVKRNGQQLRTEVTFRITSVTPEKVSATPALEERAQESAATFLRKVTSATGFRASLDATIYYFDAETGEQVDRPDVFDVGIRYKIHKINL